VVDSIYGSRQGEIIAAKTALELQSSDALLIDLDDMSLTPVNPTNSTEQVDANPGPYASHTTVSIMSSSSSVDLSESPLDSPIVPSPNATMLSSPAAPVQNLSNVMPGSYLEVTDPDVLVSRLDGGSRNVPEDEVS
jgi:hypothetical protein